MSVFLSVFWHTEQQVHAYIWQELLVLMRVLRGVGCIFYEMAAGRPLFPGSTVEDELHLIFRLLGERPPATSWRRVRMRRGVDVWLARRSSFLQARPPRRTGRESRPWRSSSPTTSPSTNRSRWSTTLPGTADTCWLPVKTILYDFCFCFFIYLCHSFWVCVARGCFCHSHECHRQEILFFADSHALPSSHEPLASHQPTSHTLNLVFVASRLDSEGIELLLSFLKVSFATHTPTSLSSCCTFFHR